MSKIPQSARDIVAARSMSRCERCGMRGSEIHHRLRRREGGHPVGILVNLCGTCHRTVHAHPAHAKLFGFIIPPWHKDPNSVPIKTYSEWVLFDDEGGEKYLSANSPEVFSHTMENEEL